MKKIFVIVFAALASTAVKAQFVYDYLKAADNYYKKGDFFSAAQYYEKYFGSEKGKDLPGYNPYSPQSGNKKKQAAVTSQEQATWQLAESYRQLNYPAKAEPYYNKAMQMAPAKFPLAGYRYATMLRALGRYEEAEAAFTSFLATYTAEDEYRKAAQREISNLKFIQAQLKKKDLKYYTVSKAPEGLNSTGGNYAPSWLNGSMLLFTSTRPDDTTSKSKTYTNRLYQAVYMDGQAAQVRKADLQQPRDIQQGVVSATPDGNTLFLTRWTLNGHNKIASLYTSQRNGDKWSEPVQLDASINMPGSSTQQPFVTPDGKYLLFSSNRAGGQGGFDLWYAPLESGKPGIVANMGSTVNTPDDEQAPFYHEASKSLVFSSNGRVGMGGFDFFQSKGTIGSFAEPTNLGYPVNSVKDDIYFTSRGTARNMLSDVWMSSDRDAACCLELFFLKKVRPLKQLSGRIISCDPSKPLTSAKVLATEVQGGKTLFTTTTGADGSYSFTLEDYVPVKISAEATGFVTNTANATGPGDDEEEKFSYPDLCLLPEAPKVNETFVIENVYYDFNKSNLKPESYPALDEVVRMLNTYPAMVIEIGAHTDNIGSEKYNIKLSDARAKSVVDYLVSKGIDPSRLRSKGYGESMPIEPNRTDNGKDNPEGREKNRRTEFKVLEN